MKAQSVVHDAMKENQEHHGASELALGMTALEKVMAMDQSKPGPKTSKMLQSQISFQKLSQAGPAMSSAPPPAEAPQDAPLAPSDRPSATAAAPEAMSAEGGVDTARDLEALVVTSETLPLDPDQASIVAQHLHDHDQAQPTVVEELASEKEKKASLQQPASFCSIFMPLAERKKLILEASTGRKLCVSSPHP